jgi:hypothetical protein
MRWRGIEADPSDSADHTGAAVVGLVPFGLVGAVLVLLGDPAGWVGIGLLAAILVTVGALAYRARVP